MLAVRWKTAAVHQKMIMLDEGDEDNKQALLKPVMEREGSTSSFFGYSTLVAILVGPLPEWCTEEN